MTADLTALRALFAAWQAEGYVRMGVVHEGCPKRLTDSAPHEYRIGALDLVYGEWQADTRERADAIADALRADGCRFVFVSEPSCWHGRSLPCEVCGGLPCRGVWELVECSGHILAVSGPNSGVPVGLALSAEELAARRRRLISGQHSTTFRTRSSRGPPRKTSTARLVLVTCGCRTMAVCGSSSRTSWSAIISVAARKHRKPTAYWASCISQSRAQRILRIGPSA
jgi:hypothetical protein